jgi:hypothetical protein
MQLAWLEHNDLPVIHPWLFALLQAVLAVYLEQEPVHNERRLIAHTRDD